MITAHYDLLVSQTPELDSTLKSEAQNSRPMKKVLTHNVKYILNFEYSAIHKTPL